MKLIIETTKIEKSLEHYDLNLPYFGFWDNLKEHAIRIEAISFKYLEGDKLDYIKVTEIKDNFAGNPSIQVHKYHARPNVSDKLKYFIRDFETDCTKDQFLEFLNSTFNKIKDDNN